jgi:hypothetical protein
LRVQNCETYQFALILDGQGSIRQDHAKIDLVLVLEAAFRQRRFPLLGERSGRVVLLKDRNLLARLLECV